MILQIRHITRYKFDHPVRAGLQQVRKTPKSTHHQRVVHWTTDVTGGRKELAFEDHHNNTVELLNFDKDATELLVACHGEVELTETHGVVGPHIGPAPLWLYTQQTELTRPGAGVRALVRDITPDNPIDGLHALLPRVSETVSYEIGASESGWTAEEAIAAGKGVCQDHAHVFLSAARELGWPARYVSGYLMIDGRQDQDAMHAWVEAYVKDLGWVGFDPSNGISPDRRYVRVATGLDYADAAPVTGTRVGGAGETLQVQIEVAQQ